ncbi:helix-turn-helix domain-containing protein [Nonomuraea sp. 10N515B]|uniref:helix-turn-helix domain-containing protein n=1 Tax=Nonomuraea sp. 10N515B TaxID=3457422 RepID=UPI003FCD6346
MSSRPPAAPLHQRAEAERTKRGWTRDELARHAGIGRLTYDRLATNLEPPIPRTVRKLCQALDIDLAEGLRLAGIAEPGGVAQAEHVAAARQAMEQAYRGDLEGTLRALASMGPEQLRELSAAASMLAALADEELSTR